MLNRLTEQLYSEGYTRENHPDYVCWGDFENFGYKWEFLVKMVWITGCGLLVQGRTVATSDVSYDGEWYCPENDNPVFRCPHEKRDCPYQVGALAKYSMCICHRTDREYDYQASAEKVEKDIDAKRAKEYREITGGQYCVNVVASNGYEAGYYEVRFDPTRCIQYGCKNEVCSITKKPRDLSKCNIFYDIVREWKTRSGIIEETKTAVEKGVKVFPKPVARTDAELWLARKKASYNPFLSKKSILDPHLTLEDQRMAYFSKHHRQWPGYDYFEFSYSVQNIRIAKSEQRDLLQDLQDVENGIEVFHASDAEKEKTQKKRDAKQKRTEEKTRKIEKAHLKAFDEHWEDPIWQATLRSFFREDYETMIRKKQEEAAGIGQQISLF